MTTFTLLRSATLIFFVSRELLKKDFFTFWGFCHNRSDSVAYIFRKWRYHKASHSLNNLSLFRFKGVCSQRKVRSKTDFFCRKNIIVKFLYYFLYLALPSCIFGLECNLACPCQECFQVVQIVVRDASKQFFCFFFVLHKMVKWDYLN